MVATRTLGIALTARINAEHPVRVNFVYDTTDPWAVTLDVATTPHDPQKPTVGLNWTRWHFSRDLLTDGLNSLTGEGDVRVFPDEGNAAVWVELSSPFGHAYVVFAKADIEKALERTENLVTPGTEYHQVDWAREWELLASDRSDTRPGWGEPR